MKRKLLKSKMFKAVLVVTGLLLSGTIFGQTVTILNGQTVDAADILTTPNVIINAGGTLNMDVSRNFTSITTSGGGTSTISGTAEATVTTLTVGVGNTLSVNTLVTPTNLVTATLNNQTATLAGTGTIAATAITINGASGNITATLAINFGLTVRAIDINAGAGNGQTDHNLTVNGLLRIQGALTGIENLNGGTNSTVEYIGGNNQAVYDGNYFNLTLAGTGAKTFSGDRDLDGNFLLEAGASLSLGGNTLTMNSGNARTATINGTLNINGDGRLLKMNTPNKTLVIGSQGILNLTDAHSGNGLEMPLFGTYTFAATSTVNYGAADDQLIADIQAPGYGNLIVSGASGTKVADDALDIQGDFTLTSSTFNADNFTHSLKGDWIRNGGTFTTGTGRISFTGAAAQEIGGSQATTFYNVTFANTNGGVTLTKPATISSNAGVTFTSGVVNTDATNVLIFNDNATSSLAATSATTTSYVSGPVRKVGNDNFTFPVGKAGTGFVPVRIEGIGGINSTNNAFVAEYKRQLPMDRDDITAAGIDHISGCDYWTVDRPVSNSDAVDVTFYWNANSPCNSNPYVTQASSVRAVHYNGNQWNAASTSLGTTNVAGGQVTWTNLNNFSPFALGSTSIDENPLPVIFGDVRAYEKNGGVQIDWSNLTEKDVAEYSIERSSNGKDFSAIAKQLPTSNQDDKASYTAFDAIPNAGANYYRIKAEETTGKIVYSKVLSVHLGKTDAGLRLYPNPVSGNQVTISLSNMKNGKYNLRVINTAGQDIHKQVINNQSSNMTQTLDLPSSIKPGVYNLVVTGDNYRATKTFIVQ